MPARARSIVALTALSLLGSGCPSYSSLPCTMAESRAGTHVATLLEDGRVLVVGPGAEVYDPASDSWHQVEDPRVERALAAARLADGRVAVLALGEEQGIVDVYRLLLYVPGTESWSEVSLVTTTRPTLLTPQEDGGLLVGLYLAPADLSSFDLLPSYPRASAPVQLAGLSDGRLLGVDSERGEFAVLDPAAEAWSEPAPVREPDGGPVQPLLIALRGGRALLLSPGRDAVFEPSEGDRWVPVEWERTIFDRDWVGPYPEDVRVIVHSADRVELLRLWDFDPERPPSFVEGSLVFDLGSRVVSAGPLWTNRGRGFTTTVLQDGRVLVVGGQGVVGREPGGWLGFTPPTTVTGALCTHELH